MGRFYHNKDARFKMTVMIFCMTVFVIVIKCCNGSKLGDKKAENRSSRNDYRSENAKKLHNGNANSAIHHRKMQTHAHSNSGNENSNQVLMPKRNQRNHSYNAAHNQNSFHEKKMIKEESNKSFQVNSLAHSIIPESNEYLQNHFVQNFQNPNLGFDYAAPSSGPFQENKSSNQGFMGASQNIPLQSPQIPQERYNINNSQSFLAPNFSANAYHHSLSPSYSQYSSPLQSSPNHLTPFDGLKENFSPVYQLPENPSTSIAFNPSQGVYQENMNRQKMDNMQRNVIMNQPQILPNQYIDRNPQEKHHLYQNPIYLHNGIQIESNIFEPQGNSLQNESSSRSNNYVNNDRRHVDRSSIFYPNKGYDGNQLNSSTFSKNEYDNRNSKTVSGLFSFSPRVFDVPGSATLLKIPKVSSALSTPTPKSVGEFIVYSTNTPDELRRMSDSSLGQLIDYFNSLPENQQNEIVKQVIMSPRPLNQTMNADAYLLNTKMKSNGYYLPISGMLSSTPNFLSSAGSIVGSVNGVLGQTVRSTTNNVVAPSVSNISNMLSTAQQINHKISEGSRHATKVFDDFSAYRQLNPEDALVQLINAIEDSTTIKSPISTNTEDKHSNESAKKAPEEAAGLFGQAHNTGAQGNQKTHQGPSDPLDLSKIAARHQQENENVKKKIAMNSDMDFINSIVSGGFDMALNMMGAPQLKQRHQEKEKNQIAVQNAANMQTMNSINKHFGFKS